MAVRRGSVPWHVLIFENSDPLVLKDDLVEVGVGLGGVAAHRISLERRLTNVNVAAVSPYSSGRPEETFITG
jgi:hypothetical protein